MRIAETDLAVGPAYVIAEIGVNHDGCVDRALELVDACAHAGASAVKTQYFRTDRLMSRAARLAAYQRAAGECDPTAMLRRLELSIGDLSRVVQRAHERGVHAIVTPFDVVGAAEMQELAWDAFKSASPDIVHRALLEAIAGDALARPLIVSTGASTLSEIVRASAWLGALVPSRRLALLHCVSAYPAPSAALGGMLAMLDASREGAFGTPAPIIGYSDHTPQPETVLHAARLGARIIEKHVTLDRSLAGPDHAASITPVELAASVRELRARQGSPTRQRDVPGAAIGARAKCVLDCERDVRSVSRQSLVLTRDVRAGERLTPEMVAYKRPGTGLAPWRLSEALGRMFTRAVACDEPVPASALGLDALDEPDTYVGTVSPGIGATVRAGSVGDAAEWA